MANEALAGEVSWLVGESLKNRDQIYGQKFSTDTVINIEPPVGALSVEEAVKLFCTVFKRLITLKTVEEFAADSLMHELTA